MTYQLVALRQGVRLDMSKLNIMLYNYIKTSLRHLRKHKLLTAINLVGLTMGLTSVVIIAIYAHFILTYDHMHSKVDNIYMVYKERVTPNGVQPTYDTWIPLKTQLEMDYPQISTATRLAPLDGTVTIDNQSFEEDFQFVDETFFDVFDFPLVLSNGQSPFTDLNSVVISQEVADRLFGPSNPIGQQITIQESFLEFEKDYIVSGVLSAYEPNNSVAPSMLFPVESIPDYEQYADYWDGSFLFTYIVIPNQEQHVNLETSFPDLVEKIWDERTRNNTNLKLLPLAEVYDTMVGEADNAYLMCYVALAILLIAVFNFMNLSTANALERAKEVGVRKVLGAIAGSIRWQFVTETMIITVASTLISVGLAYLLLPTVNDLLDMDLGMGRFMSFDIIAGVFIFSICLGGLAASYPSIYLSNMGLSHLVVGRLSHRGASGIRSTMMTLQFALGSLMIIATLGINRQINFMVETNMGFNKERIVLNASVDDFENNEIGEVRIKTFKDFLNNIAGVEEVTSSRHVPAQWSRSFTFARPQGWEGDPMRMRFTYMDATFFKAFDIPMQEGDGFLPDRNGHQRDVVVLNSAALKAFGWTDIIDKVVMIGNNELRVVGMVNDFNFESLREEIAPTLMMHRTADHPVHQYISFEVPLKSSNAVLTELEEKWTSLGALTPLEYSFLDDQVALMYQDETRLLSLTRWFTALAIFIAALGLYGLSAFVIERKRREISIRKVMGATLEQLWLLIMRKFVTLYLIAFFIGGLSAYFFLEQWLAGFAFRSGISVVVFAIALVAMLVMIVLTVSYKTIGAGRANPVIYLRDE